MHLHIQPFIKSIYHSPIYPQSIHFHSDPSVYSFTFPPINSSIFQSLYPPYSNPNTHPHFHPPVLQIPPLTYPPIYPPKLPLTHQPIQPPDHPPPFIALSFCFCHPPEADCSYFNVFTCPVVYEIQSCQIRLCARYNNGPVRQSESSCTVCLYLACCCSIRPRMLLTSNH
jgi:hypothetical protein